LGCCARFSVRSLNQKTYKPLSFSEVIGAWLDFLVFCCRTWICGLTSRETSEFSEVCSIHGVWNFRLSRRFTLVWKSKLGLVRFLFYLRCQMSGATNNLPSHFLTANSRVYVGRLLLHNYFDCDLSSPN
ncbi:hypothetical protein CRM22_001850, partial [Opisthorchis felineus]